MSEQSRELLTIGKLVRIHISFGRRLDESRVLGIVKSKECNCVIDETFDVD